MKSGVAFETTIRLGWGIRSVMTSAIRREAEKLNLTLKPFPFAKIEPVSSITISATGTPENIELFKSYLKNRGLY